MKKIATLMVLAMTVALGAQGAWANGGAVPTNMTDGTYGPVGSVTPNSNTGEFEIYNAMNLLLGTSYSNNAQFDNLEVPGSTSTWSQTGNGGYAVIGLGAGASNAIAVYNSATPGTLINPLGGFTGDGPTGNGTIGSPYTGTGAVFSSGTQFGFALTSNYKSVVTTWYSDPSLNSDGVDHMLAYHLTSLAGAQVYVYDPNTNSEQLVTLNDPYLLTFEDQPEDNNGANDDQDYNDLMVIVDGVAPVPEPMTWALFAFGLLAMAGFTLRRQFAFVK